MYALHPHRNVSFYHVTEFLPCEEAEKKHRIPEAMSGTTSSPSQSAISRKEIIYEPYMLFSQIFINNLPLSTKYNNRQIKQELQFQVSRELKEFIKAAARV